MDNSVLGGRISRRGFMAAGLATTSAVFLGSVGCVKPREPEEQGALSVGSAFGALPLASPDPESPFGIDQAVNMETIDRFLLREDTAYRDVRMLDDPAQYVDIGGNSKLDITLEGFKTVPYPYVGTLQQLPVAGAYDGPCLYAVEWSEGGSIVQARPNYKQSSLIVEELFPKDKNIILVCGGGGYAGMMRQLLVHLGWDESRVYNAGGMWDYAGNRSIQLITYENPDKPTYYSWRAVVSDIRFDELEPIHSA